MSHAHGRTPKPKRRAPQRKKHSITARLIPVARAAGYVDAIVPRRGRSMELVKNWLRPK